jgi:predicted transcriptional regulator
VRGGHVIASASTITTIEPAKEPIMRVRELMNRALVTIAESSSCREAVELMHRARIRHLPEVAPVWWTVNC